MPRPFRWDVRRREQLGELLGYCEYTPPDWAPDLRRACARVVATAGDADLLFVGRSPESLFDYLSGMLQGTSWEPRVRLMNVSIRAEADERNTAAIEGFRAVARDVGFAPRALLHSDRPIALVDVVASGGTYGALAGMITGWAREEGVDVPGVRRKLRFIGLTKRKHTSPNTWRWQQHNDWVGDFPASAIKNVSLPRALWGYIANFQPKVAKTYPQTLWADDLLSLTTHTPAQLSALRTARALYELAVTREERAAFTRLLGEEHAMRESWCRALIGELRGRSARAP